MGGVREASLRCIGPVGGSRRLLRVVATFDDEGDGSDAFVFVSSGIVERRGGNFRSPQSTSGEDGQRDPHCECLRLNLKCRTVFQWRVY